MPFRAASTVNDGLTTNPRTITVPVPAAAQAGDYALVFLTWNLGVAQTMTAPAGWGIVQYATGPPQAWAYGRLLTADDLGTAPVWTGSVGGELIGGMVVYSGVDPASPVDASTQLVTTASGTSPSAPAVTSTVDGDTVLDSWHVRNNTGGTFTQTAPGSHTQRVQANSSMASTGQNVSLLVAELTASPVPAGTFGPYDTTLNRNGTCSALAVALTAARTAVVYDLTGSGVLAPDGGSPTVQAVRAVTGSGQLALAGQAGVQAWRDVRATGQLALSGPAVTVRLQQQLTPTAGPLYLVGPATTPQLLQGLTGRGLLPLTGQAALRVWQDLRATGQLTPTGTGVAQLVEGLAAAGQLALSGPAVSPVRQLGVAGTGQLGLTGRAAPTGQYLLTATGQLGLTGLASPTLETAGPQVYDVQGSGQLTPTGRATLTARRALTGTGRLAPTGPAVPQLWTYALTAAGQLAPSGPGVTGQQLLALTARAVVPLSGRAALTQTYLLAAAGALRLAGPSPDLSGRDSSVRANELVWTSGPYLAGWTVTGPRGAVSIVSGPGVATVVVTGPRT